MIQRRSFLKYTVATGVVALSAGEFLGASTAEKNKAPLNVVFLLVDDMGWTGPGSFGGDLHETPNIDKLVSEGMKFTNAYAACAVCSPSRAAILTGKYPARLHTTDWIPGAWHRHKLESPDWKKYLDHSEVTIAEALKTAGYKTEMLSPGETVSLPAARARIFSVMVCFILSGPFRGSDSEKGWGGQSTVLPVALDQ